MAVTLHPYLNFRDTTREAMTFYQSVLGGTLEISTFAEFHASEDPAEADKVMHSHLTSELGLEIMAADIPNGMAYTPGDEFSVSLVGSEDDEEVLTAYFQALSDGGTVIMPLDKAPWGASFGMVRDRFGVGWMVNIGG